MIAAVVLAVILAYFGIRSAMRGSLGSEVAPAETAGPAEVAEAIVVPSESQLHQVKVGAKGRTAPDKSVTVKSGTAGTVISTPVREGTFVKQGTLLCALEVESRSARVKEAEAARDAAVIQRLSAVGSVLVADDPAQFGSWLNEQRSLLEQLIRDAKITLT